MIPIKKNLLYHREDTNGIIVTSHKTGCGLHKQRVQSSVFKESKVVRSPFIPMELTVGWQIKQSAKGSNISAMSLKYFDESL